MVYKVDWWFMWFCMVHTHNKVTHPSKRPHDSHYNYHDNSHYNYQYHVNRRYKYNQNTNTQGKQARYVPGWDCHGLPIELKVLQSMTDEQRAGLTPIKLRRKARDFALKTVKQQKEQFQRYVLTVCVDRSMVYDDYILVLTDCVCVDCVCASWCCPDCICFDCVCTCT